MEFTESVTHVIKNDCTLKNTYTDVVSELLFKVSCIADSAEYSESRVLGFQWCKEHGESFIEFADITQDDLVLWAKNAVGEAEIQKIKSDLEAQIKFINNNPIEV